MTKRGITALECSIAIFLGYLNCAQEKNTYWRPIVKGFRYKTSRDLNFSSIVHVVIYPLQWKNTEDPYIGCGFKKDKDGWEPTGGYIYAPHIFDSIKYQYFQVVEQLKGPPRVVITGDL